MAAGHVPKRSMHNLLARAKFGRKKRRSQLTGAEQLGAPAAGRRAPYYYSLATSISKLCHVYTHTYIRIYMCLMVICVCV